jgi:hypothetical protein
LDSLIAFDTLTDMNARFFLFALTLFGFGTAVGEATQADDTTVTITGQNAGPTPFINQLRLLASETDVLKSIRFTITPKAGSVTRPLSGTYSNKYLSERGNLNSDTGEIFLPVYGLYAGASNTVTLNYFFNDGSSKQSTTTITTDTFDDPCGYQDPIVLQPRTDSTALSYDYILVKGACSDFSPAIIDTDGALRWVGTAGASDYSATFFDNAIYQEALGSLVRIDLDGTMTTLATLADYGVTGIHHNIDRGKTGIILDVDTADQFESVNIEVDVNGQEIKRWDMAEIISGAMLAGGDDPSQFVYPSPTDWFHNNAVTYNRADDSLIVSSRENFLICVDYGTGAIKWILGDTTKKWYEFPSLAKYALSLAPADLAPIGQHAPSVTYDQGLMVFDNGQNSGFQDPRGILRSYASPRKYQIDPETMTATEVWNYPQNQTIYSPFCGSVYEDAPLNYLIDYAIVGGPGATPPFAQLLGLDATQQPVFYYQYVTSGCNTAFNSVPLHLEGTSFPTIGPETLNLSTRADVGSGEDALIEGLIVTGSSDKAVVFRALGPSLASTGLGGVLSDPTLTLFDAAGKPVATNDNWQSDVSVDQIEAEGLAPQDSAECALLVHLTPGAYTAVVTGVKGGAGIALVEAYDLSPTSGSLLGNMSSRGVAGTGDDGLISGLIIGDVGSSTVVIRALGPSLASSGIVNVAQDPALSVYDSNGVALATNDNWQDDPNSTSISQNNLAPSDPAEAATILHLPVGAYTAIVSSPDGATGVGLIEIYNLE